MAVPARFVGRERELELLSRRLDAAAGGQSATVLVGGEAGIGKTELLRNFSGLAEAQGAGVWWGATPVPVGEQIPYAPVLELLRTIAKREPEALVALGEQQASLAPLLPGSLAGWPATDEFARFRLLAALAALSERLAERRTTVIVFDDLHWADRPTLDVVSFLAQQLRDSRVLLTCLYRSDELETSPELTTWLAELVRLEQVDHLELGGLSEDELLLSAGLPPVAEAPDRRYRELAGRADGNPYFLGQLLEAGEVEGSLPAHLSELLLKRLRRLPPESAILARSVAVAGRAATGRLLAALVGGSEDSVLHSLRLLVQGHVLSPPSEADAPYTFRHPLLQEAVLAEMLPDERALLHARVAHLLEQGPATADPAAIVERAIHRAAAPNTPSSLPAFVEGARAAQQLHAFELAHRFLEKALQLEPLVEAADEDQNLAELLKNAAESAYLSGKAERAVQLARQALNQPATDAIRVQLEERLGWYQLALADVGAALDSLHRAAELARLAHPGEQARVLASLGRALLLAGDYAAARANLEHAVEASRRQGSPSDESRALRALAAVLVRLGEVRAAGEHLDAARRLDELRSQSTLTLRPSRIGYLLGSLLDEAVVLEGTGRTEDAAEHAGEALDRARRLGGAGAWGGQAAGRAAQNLYLLGRWNEASELVGDAMSRSPGADETELALVRARLAIARGVLHDAQAALDAARGALRQRTTPALEASVSLIAAELALSRGRPDGARLAVDEALTVMPGDDRLMTVEAVALGLRALADAQESARPRRDLRAADARREDALGLAALAGVAVAGVDDATSQTAGRARALGLLCEAELGRLLDEPSLPQKWADVAQAFEGLGEPYNVALARLRQAEAHLRRQGERSHAQTSLQEAHQLAVRLDARGLSSAIQALALRARFELTAAGADASAAEQKPLEGLREELGLSARELEVLALLAEGRTNRQIAEHLFISQKTAAHHVSNLLSKLGLSSRIEAAALAHRHGLLSLPDEAI